MANIKRPYRPTTRTEGAVGDIFTNTATGEQYRCTDVHEVRTDEVTRYYEWVRIISGGGNDPGSNGVFTDETTGIKYVLKVKSGDLMMEKV